MKGETGVRRPLLSPQSDVENRVNKVRVVHVVHPHSPIQSQSSKRVATKVMSDNPMTPQKKNKNLPTVCASFAERYELIDQIGKGASSTVWRCSDKFKKATFAAKIIDLRPLKLREHFDVERFRREIDIMKKLHHPNIIKLEDSYESDDQLILVLEYAYGVELFDSILSKKHYSEKDAKPIFLQIARALYYMHSRSIIHRDVKPENIMIQESASIDGLKPASKLLDFGLSKMVGEGMGSAAITFVGTPCYLAPEVEMRRRGEGGTYGTAVDCWSLGAVLYVMLAGRFPEFVVLKGHQMVRLSGQSWENMSDDAKSLVRGLMAYDPNQRMSIDQALHSAWLADELKTDSSLPLSLYSFHTAPTEISLASSLTSTALLAELEFRAPSKQCAGIDVAPLLQLHSKIAGCLDSAMSSFSGGSVKTASSLRKSALLCRENLILSVKLLRKIENTAVAVLDLVPDLKLAVEEQEPSLAHEFFSTVREWVGELYTSVKDVQRSNQANAHIISDLMAANAIKVSIVSQQPETDIAEQKRQVSISQRVEALDDIEERISPDIDGENNEQLFDLFLHFSNVKQSIPNSSLSEALERKSSSQDATTRSQIHCKFEGISSNGSVISEEPESEHGSSVSRQMSIEMQEKLVSEKSQSLGNVSDGSHNSLSDNIAELQVSGENFNSVAVISDVKQALHLLREVDIVLEQLAMFWANTEIIFDMLLRKGDLVEKFVSFAGKPKLLNRFEERMNDYKRFWECVRHLCNHYLNGSQVSRAYGSMEEVVQNCSQNSRAKSNERH